MKKSHRKAVQVLFFTVFLFIRSARSFVPSTHTLTRKQNILKRRCDEAENDDCSATSLPWTIPIFPLRKSIKFPGESLTLNLYEERYLALGTWIRHNQTNTQQMFGALYASEMPQIISDRGRGPIVPLLQPGDIGVLFLVQRWEQGIIPTRSMGQRHRIRMVGTGVARFCIEKLLHNGYGVGENMGTEEAVPFILAQVRLYRDEAGDKGGVEPSSLPIPTRAYNQSSLSDKEIESLVHQAKVLGIPDTVMEKEFHSFLMASMILPQGACNTRKYALRSQSTTDRLNTLFQNKYSTKKRT